MGDVGLGVVVVVGEKEKGSGGGVLCFVFEKLGKGGKAICHIY